MSEALTMPVAAVDDHGHPPTNTGISNEKLGMWVFLGSECLMFGGLISTYFLYKNRPGSIVSVRGREITGSDIRPSDLFANGFTSVTSFILLASSLTMVFAVAAAKRNEMARMRYWLGTTAVLGSLFIGGQVYEFTTFVREGMGYTSNVAASAFYTLTGFHGAHVTIGILMLLITIAMSARGRIPHAKAEAVEIVGLYWHFVDVVWILVFTIVYLIK
ncbi:MAG: heme-copper oxidase subunit III [Microthrixaceae bacterium]|nr:heme-copper oxidase subunit III [Microthrixaceae bacterium]HPB44276.1 heme-copper oxidase subunit III [Microthrixaceae bacterium]